MTVEQNVPSGAGAPQESHANSHAGSSDVPAPDLIAEAITFAFGERCPDLGEYCPVCQAWAQYDAMVDVLQQARRVMDLLEEYGASIVPHLLDNDDNAGQFLRDALAKAEGRATPVRRPE